MSGIPLDWLVSVTSAGVRDKFSLSKLPTLLITKPTSIPCEQWLKFYDSTSVSKALGINSSAAHFASNYFSFTNKKASNADLLNVLVYNSNALPAAIKGGILSDINKLNTLQGTLALEMSGVKRDIEVDFSACVSYSDLATRLQEAIRMAGAPLITLLEVTQKESTELTIEKGAEGAATHTLVIHTNAQDLEVINNNSEIISYDDSTKTITALKEGESTLTFTAARDDFNTIKQNIKVVVTSENNALKIAVTLENKEVIKIDFSIITNANNYNVTFSNSDIISFDKNKETLTGLKKGDCVLTFKAQYKSAESAQKSFKVSVSDSLGLTIQENEKKEKAAKNRNNEVIQDFALASVVFNNETSGFIVKSGINGADSNISFSTPATYGVDISSKLGLSENEGAQIYSGYNAISTFSELLDLIKVINGGYYLLQFDFTLSDDELLEFCKFVNNSNDRYAAIINTQDKKIITQEGTLDKYQGYNGVFFEYTKDKSPLGLSAGIVSAIDYSVTNGNANIAFNDCSNFESIALTTQQELNILESNKANSILKFAQIGQSQVWYGMGNILGTKTNSANVYFGNSYLKFQLQFSLANMFNAQSFIGLRGSDNEAIIMAYIENVFIGAVKSGIIIEGVELTTAEKQALYSAFGNKGESAVTQCARNGYFYAIDNVDLVNKKITIVDAYVANTPAKRIVINNYILGA